ncbi:MAG: AAA family ATPase, partial [Clostridia bacterium]
MKQADFESPKLRAMLYGDSGSGKTRLLGSAMYCTETCPILIMNARGQPQSLKGQDKKPLVLTVETMTDFNMVYDWFSRGQPVPKPIATNGYTPEVITDLPDPFNWIYEYLVKGEYERFNSFGVDSITQVQRIAMDAVQRTDEQWRPDYIPDKSTYGDWGKILSLLTKFADYHFDLPVHVFITALTRRDEVPSLGTT